MNTDKYFQNLYKSPQYNTLHFPLVSNLSSLFLVRGDVLCWTLNLLFVFHVFWPKLFQSGLKTLSAVFLFLLFLPNCHHQHKLSSSSGQDRTRTRLVTISTLHTLLTLSIPISVNIAQFLSIAANIYLCLLIPINI